MSLAGAEAGLVDRLEDNLDGRLVGRQVRRETALVADRGIQAARREHALQRVEYLGAVTHRLAQAAGARPAGS